MSFNAGKDGCVVTHLIHEMRKTIEWADRGRALSSPGVTELLSAFPGRCLIAAQERCSTFNADVSVFLGALAATFASGTFNGEEPMTTHPSRSVSKTG